MKKALEALHGLRSAIMAVVLLIEVVAQGLGFESGPVFAAARGVMSYAGWETTDLAFDPAVAGAAILTLYATYQRVRAWWRDRATRV